MVLLASHQLCGVCLTLHKGRKQRQMVDSTVEGKPSGDNLGNTLAMRINGVKFFFEKFHAISIYILKSVSNSSK
jgi:hypothetical protein